MPLALGAGDGVGVVGMEFELFHHRRGCEDGARDSNVIPKAERVKTLLEWCVRFLNTVSWVAMVMCRLIRNQALLPWVLWEQNVILKTSI